MRSRILEAVVSRLDAGRPGPRVRLFTAALFCMLLLSALRPAALPADGEELARSRALQEKSVAVSPPRISDHEIEKLKTMDPQQQAMLLVERVINHYQGALELMEKDLEEWRGKLKLTPELNSLIVTGINSNDLRVRGAALDIDLAANNLAKTPESVFTVIQRMHDQPASRPWGAWVLGALGNRGIETERVFNTLIEYSHDPDEETRFSVVEGLSYLGGTQTIQPLLEIFRHDSALRVREHALAGIAQVGMLTKDERMTAVPELLNLADDATLDATSRGWVFQALRDVTGADIGSDPAAWRAWWAEHPRK